MFVEHNNTIVCCRTIEKSIKLLCSRFSAKLKRGDTSLLLSDSKN